MSTAQSRFGKSKFDQEIRIGNHSLIADAPVSAGGADAGPEPHDFLAVALSSCTGMTLQMYASRKSWPLDDVQVSVTSKTEGDATQFTRSIRLIGNLDAEQKARLLEIAGKCPVHKTLSGRITIQTEVV
jgi:putative redox protein